MIIHVEHGTGGDRRKGRETQKERGRGEGGGEMVQHVRNHNHTTNENHNRLLNTRWQYFTNRLKDINLP